MAKIYESPDGGKTVYVRETDTPDKERELLFDYKLMDAELELAGKRDFKLENKKSMR